MASRAATPAETFRKELQAARQRKGWTQQDLADRLDFLGVPIDRSTIAKIEAGRRGVPMEDVFALALALEVPPSALLFPRGDDHVQLAPNVDVAGWQAHMWMQGLFPITPSLAHGDVEKGDRFYFDSTTDVEAAAQRHFPLLREIQRLAARAITFGADGDRLAPELDETLAEIQEAVAAERRRARRAADREKKERFF